MNTKIISIVVLVALTAGGAGFFGGSQYTKSQSPANGAAFFGGAGNGFANLSDEERQARMDQFASGGGVGRAGTGGAMARGGAGFTAGEIIAKDENSLTVKLADNSSKIILFSTSTQVMQTSAGSLADLKIGQSITANGPANTDGSITAQSIQLRPNQ